MNFKLISKIIAYVLALILVGCVLFGSFQYYFKKPTPNTQNFAPESKPTFHSTVNNMEYHWAIGPYIAATYQKELGWESGVRLEYRF